jgi:hypothetical protein
MNDEFSSVQVDGRWYDLDGRFIPRHRREVSHKARACQFGKDRGNSTTTQKFEPPENTKPGWDAYINQGMALTQRPFQQYNLPTVAPLNDMQNTGLNMAFDRAANGAPDLNTARGMNTATMQGQFLNSNPYMNEGHVNSVINDNQNNMVSAYNQGQSQQNNAMANLNGGWGGSGWQLSHQQGAEGLAKQVGQMANTTRMGYDQMGSQDYQNERGLMNSAAGMTPQFAQDDWTAIKTATGAGDAYQAQAQKEMDAAKGQFDQQVNYPMQQLENLGSILSRASGTYGGGGTSTTSGNSPGPSALGGLLGLGSLGVGAYTSGFFR